MQLKMSTADANKPENSFLNRYRDVKPYDHSRVKLETHHDTDYINASLVKVKNWAHDYLTTCGPPLPSKWNTPNLYFLPNLANQTT